MAKRHEDAWFIQQGACNICVIARTLVETADAAASEGIQPSEDAAVRLIVHQLAFLVNTGDVDDNYSSLIAECAFRTPYFQFKEGNACEYPRKEAV